MSIQETRKNPLNERCKGLTPAERDGLQEMGADFFLNNRIADGFEPDYRKNFEGGIYIYGRLDGRPAAFNLLSVMYPSNFNKLEAEEEEFLIEYNRLHNDVSCECNTETYAVGLGFINKNAPEEEKGILKNGVKYSAVLGSVKLIAMPSDKDYGYSAENPINLFFIDDEYAYLEHLDIGAGKIINAHRCYSCMGADGHPVDKWEIAVESPGFKKTVIKYYLFLNAYGRENCDWDGRKAPKRLPAFFEWRK